MKPLQQVIRPIERIRLGDTGMAVVLAVVFALATVAIRSRAHTTNLWIDLATFSVFIGVALYFKRRIGLVSFYVYGSALAAAFTIAVMFGI